MSSMNFSVQKVSKFKFGGPEIWDSVTVLRLTGNINTQTHRLVFTWMLSSVLTCSNKDGSAQTCFCLSLSGLMEGSHS